MNKLPQEHLVPEAPKAQSMNVGDVRWMQGVQTTHDGTVWVQKTAEIFPNSGWDEQIGRHEYAFKVERLADGWKVSIPKSRLPVNPHFSNECLKTVCFEVTEIEIIDGIPPE